MENINKELKVLALKYRPKIFKELIGQEIIAETIANAIKIGKTPNAYLLTGIRGVGKTTTARLIAKALNCTNDNDQGKKYNKKDLCDHCRQIENSNHIDVLEMDAASKTGIDDVRELIENSKYNPTSSKYKIYIIDEIHMLSKQAFNGLLKTLEEPPEKLKFILATTDVRKIPVTILSRCQRFDLKRVGLEKIYEHIKKISDLEKGKISDKALKLLSKASEGSVRDAISLLDRALVYQSLDPSKTVDEEGVRKMLGLADKSKLIILLTHVFNGEEKKSMELLNELIDVGLDAKNFLNDFLELIYLFSRRINLGAFEKDLFISEGEKELIEKGSKDLNMQDLSLFWQLTLKAIEDLKVVSNENIALEMYLMQLMHAKLIDNKNFEKNIEVGSTKTEKISTKEIKEVEEIDNTKTINFAKNQMKNTDQIKTYSEKDVVNNKKFEVRSFADLIYLAEKNKEMELKYDLERNVKLANFENGNIDINFNENINKNFIKKLSQSLFEWTGKRWIITLSKNSDLKTFHEKKISNKEKLLSNEKNSATVKEMLNVFPDADLVEVKEDKDE
ncbi:MAG: DNA polymerase III, subunit gamma and tau [Euryarchaeota archaeon]|nr:DNA polymerase III, subunit gamma and tau [Euryarchaeota archaeon]